MARKPDDCFPLYIGDYLADTMHFTISEHGAALLLSMHRAMHGPLPESDERLAKIARCTAGEWRVIRKTVMAVFQGGGTRFIQRADRLMNYDNGRLPMAEWAIIRQMVFERDDYTCAYCGKRGGELQCDHIIPVSRGGANLWDNLTTACPPCNQSKNNKTPEEWRAAQAVSA